MRARTIGIVVGLILAIAVSAFFFARPHTSMATGDVTAPTVQNATITLPANETPDRVNVDFTIDSGAITPHNFTVTAGQLVAIKVLAASGPAKLAIPDAAVATPLLSERQVQTLQFRFSDPGTYEMLCNPCGTQNSLDRVLLTVK